MRPAERSSWGRVLALLCTADRCTQARNLQPVQLVFTPSPGDNKYAYDVDYSQHKLASYFRGKLISTNSDLPMGLFEMQCNKQSDIPAEGCKADDRLLCQVGYHYAECQPVATAPNQTAVILRLNRQWPKF